MLSALLFTILLILLTTFSYRYLLYRFVSAEPNEWMLVIRNGKVTESGIGISAKVTYFDKVVRFPSRIFKVNFTTSQVSKEVQGIQVAGAIVWTVNPEGEGPIKAYRNLGADLSSQEPYTANGHITELGTSIVRHRIANSTIDDILKNRDGMRAEMLTEIGKVCQGWGVKLESVEITEVKIMSEKLFENMQAPFREAQRIKADLITMETEVGLNEKKVLSETVSAKREVEKDTKQKIYNLNQNNKVFENNQKNFEQTQAIKKQRAEAESLIKRQQAEQEQAFKKSEALREFEKKKKEIDDQIALEKKKAELDAIKEESKRKKQEESLKRKEEAERSKMEIYKKKMEMVNEASKKIDFNVKLLNAASEIYSSFPVQHIQMVSFTNDGIDPFMSFAKELIESVDQKSK